MDNKKILVWLSSLEIGINRLKQLLNKFNTLEEIWRAEKTDLKDIDGIGSKLIENLVNNKNKEQIEKYIEKMQKEHISIITIEDELYPNKLRNI